MKTKEEVREFLENLQWNRTTKKELEAKLQEFFGVDKSHTLDDFTDEDCKEIDYSFVFTTGVGACTEHFIDIEIYYLKMRQRNHFIITGTEILNYVA